MTPIASVQVTPSTRLLDKYVLPKIALTVITVASLIGTWLTMTTHGASTWTQVLPRWAHFISFAVLIGGTMWKAWFIRPAKNDSQRDAFSRLANEEFALFRRFQMLALPVFAISAVWDMVRFASWGIGWLSWLDLGLVFAITLLVGWSLLNRASDPYLESRQTRLVFGLLVLDAIVQAAFDVMLAQNGDVGALLIRSLHLVAFGLWFGGAVWNIFVTVPAAREIVSLPVVIAASQQLERFRIVVTILLPTLIITGAIQAYHYVGLDISLLTSSLFGTLILIKISLIGLLILIFLICPLWRACSPIAGMCKLDDLYEKEK